MASGFVTNAGNLAARKRILAGKTEERYRRAAQTEAAKLKFVAEALSSGPLKGAQLRKMGYPYAVRFAPGTAGMPDFIINIQSGNFRAGWHTRAQKTGKGWTITLWNDSKEGIYLLGTSKMRSRLIMDEVLRRTQPAFSASVRKVSSKATQENGGTAPLGGGIFGGLVYAISAGVVGAASATAEAF